MTTRILNVDDSDGARYAKGRVLRLAGYEVIDAASGQEALDRVRADAPDLVLLDVKLPDINGREVCRRIKQDPVTATTLVLQTSAAMIDLESRVKALDAGADAFLIEPIEPEELVASVRALLRMRQAETARRQAESARDVSEARFRRFTEVLSDIFWVVDPVHRTLVYVSPAYVSHWRQAPERLQQDVFTWLDAVHPDDQPQLRAYFETLCQDGTAYEMEYRMRTGDGVERWVAERGFRLDDPHAPGVFQVAGVAQDVTLRKQAELVMIEADRHKSEFLAMLSHELRNPLAPMRSAVELMLLAQERGDAPNPRALAIVGRQLDHLSSLVDDLLDVSRINHGKIVLRREVLSLRTVLEAAADTVHSLVQAKRHRLVVDLPDPLVAVDGDLTRLVQIFGNLLNNAAKFTDEGGRIEIGHAVAPDGASIDVWVQDNGPGIRPELAPQVFDIFTQEERPLDRAQGGLGIGLSLVKRLSRLHGGDVALHSAGLGQGSRFVVTLPLTARVPKPLSIEPEPAAHGNPRRVLVVDDSPDTAEAMSLVLRARGHTVQVATDGRTALTVMREYRPQAVLLDIGLPGMDGYEVARRIRGDAELGAPVLIAVTGYGTDLDRARASAAGFDHHLVKPADFDLLYRILDDVPA